MPLEQDITASKKQRAGGDHYRAYVGPPTQYDFMGATQFRLVTGLGLREEHNYLDLGCGSLRAGRLLIPYLLPGRYYGIEPNARLYEEAIANEIGHDLISINRPRFSNCTDFDMEGFGVSFDFIVAQSIFSHAGIDLMRRALDQAVKTLAPKGQFLFTVLSEDTPTFSKTRGGASARGWIYPGCVTYTKQQVADICCEAGPNCQPLSWFHPRQHWFRAVKDKAALLSSGDMEVLGGGRVLFDERFKPSLDGSSSHQS